MGVYFTYSTIFEHFESQNILDESGLTDVHFNDFNINEEIVFDSSDKNEMLRLKKDG